MPTLVGSRFQLENVLDRDAVSVLWSAVDVQLDRPVAVRMLTPSALADPAALHRLAHDARTVAGVAHPNLVGIYASGVDLGQPYQVLELVDGAPLSTVLATGRLLPGQAADIGAQICAALAAVHAAGVVHRDLGPDNVLLTSDGVVKVGGFGLANLSDGAPADVRTDLYAVGWLLHVMLVGSPPPIDEPDVATGLRGIRPDVSPELATLVGQLLAANPASSVGPVLGADEACRRLTTLASHSETTQVGSDGRGRHSLTTPGWRRWRRPAVLAVGALIASIAALAAVLSSTGDDDPRVAMPRATAEPPTITESASEPSATATASPSPTPTPSASRASRAAELITTLRNRLPQLARDGQLDARASRELDRRLGEAAQAVAANQPERAWNSLQTTAERVGKLHNQGKITDSGYGTLQAAFTEIGQALSAG